ncbi:MAG: hypothetical protein JW951_08285 [Lentisphaerae bacterium]|nr:hypothetical protein [Lentisphaerota bacterium]
MRTGPVLLVILSVGFAAATDAGAGWFDRIRNRAQSRRRTVTATAGHRVTTNAVQVETTDSGQKVLTRTGDAWKSQTRITGGQRTDNGAAWSSTTQGDTEGGRAWSADHDAEVSRNEDGSVTLEKSGTATLESGKTLDTSRSTTLHKTEDGRVWETEGQVSGERGTSSYTGTGRARRTGDGLEWETESESAGPGGRRWSASGGGAADNGSVTRERKRR